MTRRIQISLLIAILLVGVTLVVWNAKYTVVAAEKNDSFSGVTYGYSVQQYYFWNSMRLTVWNSRGGSYQMYSGYDFGSLTVEKVVEERWLKNDLAIYLNLEIKYHDSVVSVHPARLIYDFHRGEMHTASGFTLWRIWNEKNRSEDWMTDDEFNAILNRLGT